MSKIDDVFTAIDKASTEIGVGLDADAAALTALRNQLASTTAPGSLSDAQAAQFDGVIARLNASADRAKALASDPTTPGTATAIPTPVPPPVVVADPGPTPAATPATNG